ncbi:SubName: Full=Uncharacterized protein {ECO:0000313/EMBL:CCA69350.1} [Serendipita indica DSM 11827]|uniref:Uncharacterized protein n=1 Tax=Serendipita indica (strain DSM 11827) TaxID=1109443 RepID=G4TDF7_SERID|nr:SubName: Full=Uncharacterized protein {ECO:0000313/EMBL:CCA69350.1} [Serendipita indica DSM 11827]CCA69350.1 hypothetical protein PIIN_03249 [Serendipita indica DSM 11827]
MPTEYPVEVLNAICAAVYHSASPAPLSSLDPVIHPTVFTLPAPTTLPSSYPPTNWPEPVARLTLTNLSRVSRAFYKATREYVWRRVEIRLPRTWIALVEEITGGEEIVDEEAANLVEQSLSEAASYVFAATSPTKELDREALWKLRAIIRERLERDGPLPPEVLTPPESRDASPMRPRHRSIDARHRSISSSRPGGMDARRHSKSPGRWRVIRAVSNATRSVVESVRPDVYVQMPQDSRPGRYILHLDFNHFRTIGLRRSVGEGVHSRFVTGERLHLALKEMPNLVTFGATEYMDGALTFPVLAELLFRGRPLREQQRQPSRGRNPSPEEQEPGPYDWHRRQDAQSLVALDLCGCVSAVFVKALTEFTIMYLMTPDRPRQTLQPEEMTRGRVRFEEEEDTAILFPRLKRLCLRSVSSVSAPILSRFVLAFPSLTHLDLSGTRCESDLLYDLAKSDTIRLVSLSLGRCTRLTGGAVKDFLLDGKCVAELEHLSLFGDVTCPFPISETELEAILKNAPCIQNGRLTYFDLSSHPLTPSLLDTIPPQPSLRSFGLSFITELPLTSIATFLREKAPNVEIITLSSTSPELSPTTPIRQSTIAVHNMLIGQLTTVPFSLQAKGVLASFLLPYPTSPPTSPTNIPTIMTTTNTTTPAKEPTKYPQAPTKLRVIELSPHILTALGSGAGSWRVIRSKGARGWYVDTSCGWCAEVGDEDAIMTSTNASSKVSSTVANGEYANANGEIGGKGAIFKRNLTSDHPLRKGLEALSESGGNVSTAVGWHARKMEVLHGDGMLGREDGLYGAMAFAFAG